MSLIVGLVQFPVAAGVDAAELNVWRQLTLSAGLVLCCPPTLETARQRLLGSPNSPNSLSNLLTAQIYILLHCHRLGEVFTTLSFFPPPSDLMRELQSQG